MIERPMKFCTRCLCPTPRNSQKECTACVARRRVAARLPKVDKVARVSPPQVSALTHAFRKLGDQHD